MRTNDRPGADLPAAHMISELVLGKRSADDATVRAAFAADPELERRWRELSRTAQLLEAARDFEASLLAEVREGGASLPVHEERVERVLRTEALRPRRNWRHWTVAIAAGLLFVAWISFRGRGEPDDAKVYLGGTPGTPVLLEPSGTLDASALPVFRWTFVPEPGWEGHCEVVLYDASGSELLRSPEIRAPIRGSTWEWRPAAPTTALEWIDPAQTEAFFWQVSSVSNLGAIASSAPRQVLSSPSER